MYGIRSQFLALGVLALAVFGIERLIVTDREAIENVAKEAARAILDRRFDRLEALLSEDFSFGGRDRAGTVAYVRGLVEKHNPGRVSIVFTDVDVSGDDTAHAKGAVTGSAYGRPVQVPVEAWFVRGPDGWLLSRVKASGYGVR